MGFRENRSVKQTFIEHVVHVWATTQLKILMALKKKEKKVCLDVSYCLQATRTLKLCLNHILYDTDLPTCTIVLL